ncbi:MAG: anaerobic ribonucleoside-triphosphate reductase activating protein [Candidatus Aminicenantales bacterium]
MVEIKGLEKFAPRDFPGHISSTVFLGGCNFRCPYCHNAELVLRPGSLPTLPLDEFLSFLKARQQWLEAVCISGGEPLMNKGVVDFAQLLKERGLLVKIDTNGSFPSVLDKLLERGCVDLVAMDIKAPFERYQEVTGVRNSVQRIKRSIEMIKESGVEHLFRTTVVPGLIGPEDIAIIGRMLRGEKIFQLQQFFPHTTLDSAYLEREPLKPAVFRELKKIAQAYFEEVRVEGV